MPTRAEIFLKRAAGLAGVLTLVLLVARILAADPATWPGWPVLAAIYLTGVAYGLGEMTRLYHRHRRRCQTCLSGAGPHLRWWVLRVVLVLFISVLPVLLLFPVVSRGD